MPQKPTTWQTEGWVATRVTVRARLYDDSTGLALDPSNVTAIAYTVTGATGPQQGIVTSSGGLSPVATCLNSTLSVVGWTYDSLGWNFKAPLPATAFPDPGDYVVDFVLTLADGSGFPVKAYHHARSRN